MILIKLQRQVKFGSKFKLNVDGCGMNIVSVKQYSLPKDMVGDFILRIYLQEIYCMEKFILEWNYS